MDKNKVLAILTLILLVALISGCFSNTTPIDVSISQGQTKGTIIFTAKQGEDPLKGVEIKINGQSKGSTDSDGILTVEWLLKGEYNWSAIYRGNETSFGNFTILEVVELEFVDMKLDKGVYHLGDIATGTVTVKNTGTTVIDHLTIKVAATNLKYAEYGSLATKTKSKDFLTEIYPGEEKEFLATAQIPESVMVSGYEIGGDMLKGMYLIEDEVLVDGLSFGFKDMEIEVS